MALTLVRPDHSLEAHTPLIRTIKDNIAMNILEINAHAARGSLNSYQLTRDRTNKLVDDYVKLRTLTLVR